MAPKTKRTFGLEMAYQMCNRIKLQHGCQICEVEQPVECLEWWDSEKNKLVSDDSIVVMQYREVMTVPAVVCLDCITRLREIHIPEIGDAYGNQSSE